MRDFPDGYKNFYNQNFLDQLKKYRLDYILSDGKLIDGLLTELNSIELVYNHDNFYLYKLN